ncbi:hypothetical protein [Candidatus Fukatsuia symbiotica]|nr:hypothetical protein [Candidatus Fukatsuia symbiotica]
MTAPHGQTLRSPPAKPGDYLILFTGDHLPQAAGYHHRTALSQGRR